MQASDYVDWCDVAGLYLGNESHIARYRAYGEKISPAGLNAEILHDFLRDHRDGLNVANWRSYSVYELAPQAKQRVA